MANDIKNTAEDVDMPECDGEKVVTMMDVLQEQEDFEEDANAVLGASDDKECTYSKGYIKRQAIYACLTCCSEANTDPSKRAGVCLACSLMCHENHELIELYTKRNFRCDCGNPKFNSHPCTFTTNKLELNEENQYNQNFSGLYCTCHRPYPDPESTVEDEMIQCIVCEDWLHSTHLESPVPANDQYSEMICKNCMDKNEFLHDYTHLAVNSENGDVDVVNGNGVENKTISKDPSSIINENNLDVEMTDKLETNTANSTETKIDDIVTDDKADKSENTEQTVVNKQEASSESQIETNKTEEASEAKQEQTIDSEFPKDATENSNLISDNDKTESTNSGTTENISEPKETVSESTIESNTNESKINTEKSIVDSEKEAEKNAEEKLLADPKDSVNTSTETTKQDKCESEPSNENDSKDDNKTCEVDNKQETITNGDGASENSVKQTPESSNDKEKHTEKRKLDENDDSETKKRKLDVTLCIRPKGVTKTHKGATFWMSNFRQKLCTCQECISMYKDLSVLFLTDPEDTVSAYESLGKEKINGKPATQYEKGLQALSSLDRIQQINALTEYNNMRDKLLDFLKSFKDRKEIVKEEDIKAFFAGMKPKREPDGVYFCR